MQEKSKQMDRGDRMPGLPRDYQQFIATTRYARFLPEEGRRETWEETCTRLVNYWKEKDYTPAASNPLWKELYNAIYNLEVMPSMRSLMTAGPALDRDNVAGYNCSYLPVDHVRAFDETMYILMCGTGVGFSVERQYINKLPEVAEEMHDSDTVVCVRDSKIGWASAFRELISLLYAGKIPKWDMSKLRPAGAPLKTFGGRSSGPEPLENLFRFTTTLFHRAAGRRLTSLECHDLMCKIGEVVVVGGVRRSALISLSNLTDQRMAKAKSGEWWVTDKQRALANNSVCYTERPDMGIFMKEWGVLYESKSGERGIFSRPAAQAVAKRNGRRDSEYEFGTNPCSEIILRPNQFCNLSEVVVRAGDTFDDLKRKVRLASILGTFQASLTDFRYLRRCWMTNTKEEALLGVSLTGIMDHPILNGSYGIQKGETFSSSAFKQKELPSILEDLKNVAIETNKEIANRIGIAQSAAITCVKPSGTVSQLVNSSSGIHARHSDFYIRSVRNDVKDPVTQFLIDQGVPHETDVMSPSNEVFFFPEKSPKGATTRKERSAIENLELWKIYAEHWCEHKPSITVYVREEEWMDVGAWVYKNFDSVSGVSFLPFHDDDHAYQQAPYVEVDEDTYNEALLKMPAAIEWEKLKDYEGGKDNTIGSQELACSGGKCEI